MLAERAVNKGLKIKMDSSGEVETHRGRCVEGLGVRGIQTQVRYFTLETQLLGLLTVLGQNAGLAIEYPTTQVTHTHVILRHTAHARYAGISAWLWLLEVLISTAKYIEGW